MAVPPVRTINEPKNRSVSNIGSSQNFFLTLRNPQMSFMKSIIYLSSFVEMPQGQTGKDQLY